MLRQVEARSRRFSESQPSSEDENGPDADEEHPTPSGQRDMAPECVSGGCRGKQRWLGLTHGKTRYIPAAIVNRKKPVMHMPPSQDTFDTSSSRSGTP